jgi:hypothetical protein
MNPGVRASAGKIARTESTGKSDPDETSEFKVPWEIASKPSLLKAEK